MRQNYSSFTFEFHKSKGRNELVPVCALPANYYNKFEYLGYHGICVYPILTNLVLLWRIQEEYDSSR